VLAQLLVGAWVRGCVCDCVDSTVFEHMCATTQRESVCAAVAAGGGLCVVVYSCVWLCVVGCVWMWL